MFYIPIMKTLQAEQLTLRSLSSEKRKKIIPLLQYVPNKRLELILKENPDLYFFVEFPDLYFNPEIRTLEQKETKFLELKNSFSNFYPTITVIEEEEPRQLTQHALRLLEKFDKLLIKGKLIDRQGNFKGYNLLSFTALYSCLPLEKVYFMIDFEQVESFEFLDKNISSISSLFKEAQLGFTATVWPPDQTQFEKGIIIFLDNIPFKIWEKYKKVLSFYSDYLTENPLSTVIDEPRPLTIIPYFKLTSLDGEHCFIIRALSKNPEDVKEAAQLAIEEYNFIHEDSCAGCLELKEIADTSNDKIGNPMSRKKLSFVHHLEVISALI